MWGYKEEVYQNSGFQSKKKKSQNAESLLERQTPCLEVPLARLEVRVQEEAECSDFGTPEYIII